MEKRKLLLKFRDYIESSYAPLVQRGTSTEVYIKLPLEPDLVHSLLGLWRLLINLHLLILEPPKTIWNVRLGIALAVMREEYAIISLLAHILKAYRVIKEIPEVKDDPQVLLKGLLTDFSFQYILASKYFNSLKLVPELSERKMNILPLPLGLDAYLKTLVPERIEPGQVAVLFKHSNEIMGVHVPLSIKTKLATISAPLSTDPIEFFSAPLIEEKPEKPKEEVSLSGSVIFREASNRFCFNTRQNSAMNRLAVFATNPRKEPFQPQLKEEPVRVQFVPPRNSVAAPPLFPEAQPAPPESETTTQSQIIQSVDLLGIEDGAPLENNVPSYKSAEVAKSAMVQQAKPEKVETPEKNVEEIKEDNVKAYAVQRAEPVANPLEKVITEELDKSRAAFFIDMTEVKAVDRIGSGASAEVFKAIYRGTEVAVKALRTIKENDTEKVKELRRELNALLLLRHPNLVLFMGAGITPKGTICLVTEFCGGGTLFNLLHESLSVSLTWRQRCKIALDVAKGMNSLHSYKPPIIHRDLKSLNLLLVEPVTGPNDPALVKVTDFGLARFQAVDQYMTGAAGTFHWMAPEVLMNKPYTIKADVYSYGIVLWELITREKPYDKMNGAMIIYRVVNLQERPDQSCIPEDCPSFVFFLFPTSKIDAKVDEGVLEYRSFQASYL